MSREYFVFAWQGNNTVLGITTAYSPDDLVIRTRKRPAATSTNAAIVRPVFGDEYTKDLAIPNRLTAASEKELDSQL